MKELTVNRLLALLLILSFILTTPVSVQAATEPEMLGSTKANTILSEENVRLLSTIIYCEAGCEPYAGKLAVGIVVINRMKSDKFPNSLEKVVYQKGQFTPAQNGILARMLKKYDNGAFNEPNQIASIQAAIEVLEGRNSVTLKGKEVNMDSYLFFSVHLKGYRLKIGNHKFK